MHTDYIIVGQGISGTLLSRELLRDGYSVIIIDEDKLNTASRTACGLINPVTGKRYVKSWRFDELMDTAIATYQSLGQELALKLIQEYLLIHFFQNQEEEKLFEDRIKQGSEHLYFVEDTPVWENYFHFDNRVGAVQPCYMLSLPLLLEAWRKKLVNTQSVLSEKFDFDQLVIEKNSVHYKDLTATKIVFCDGIANASNGMFNMLPFSKNKGEALIVAIDALPKEFLYMNGLKIAPWRDGLFWVGTSFDWKYENDLPTNAFRTFVENKLNQWLKLPFTILEHRAAERPSSADYHPFLGVHPEYANVAVFNGQGTKGCSQTPFFAKQMKDFLVQSKPLEKEVDIARFLKTLK